MAKAVGFEMHIPGLESTTELTINYNPTNLRITTVDWVISNLIYAHVTLWRRNEPSPPVMLYDRVIAGPASGSESVPGNWRMQTKQDEEGIDYLDLPDDLLYQVLMETVR